MTLPRLDALMGYYEDHPPVHLMVAAYMGVKRKPKPQPQRPAASPGAASGPAQPDFFELLTSLQHG